MSCGSLQAPTTYPGAPDSRRDLPEALVGSSSLKPNIWMQTKAGLDALPEHDFRPRRRPGQAGRGIASPASDRVFVVVFDLGPHIDQGKFSSFAARFHRNHVLVVFSAYLELLLVATSVVVLAGNR